MVITKLNSEGILKQIITTLIPTNPRIYNPSSTQQKKGDRPDSYRVSQWLELDPLIMSFQ